MLKKLRFVHLYLGCVFAPMLVFFALSGIWQTKAFDFIKNKPTYFSILQKLSTIHTGRGLKTGGFNSVYLDWFAVIMAVALIVTIILGVVMAFKYGRGKIAAICVASGIVVPLVIIYLTHR